MDKRYVELFSLITQSTANLAEQVMDNNKDKESKEYKNAQIMRDDYQALHDKLTNEEILNKADFARILVGAILIVNQLEARIKTEEKALRGYKLDVIPKLDQINNAEINEVESLAASLFEVKEEEEEEEEEEEDSEE